MSHDILRALTGSADQPAITLEQSYRTSADDLWQALTDPQRLARWFGRMSVMPVAVGDPFEVHLSDDPVDFGRGVLIACHRPSTLGYTWSWGREPESEVSLSLTPVNPQQTTLRLHHRRLAPVETVGYGGGWEEILAALASVLDPDHTPTPGVEERAVRQWQTITARPMTLSHTFPASAADLWQAFTTAEGLRRWWWTHWDDVTIDIEAGRGYRITVPSQRIELWGSCLSSEPGSHLAFSWCWRGADGVLVPDEAVDIRLVEVDGGTRVDVRHTGPWDDDTAAADYRVGWEFTLDSLGSRLRQPS